MESQINFIVCSILVETLVRQCGVSFFFVHKKMHTNAENLINA